MVSRENGIPFMTSSPVPFSFSRLKLQEQSLEKEKGSFVIDV